MLAKVQTFSLLGIEAMPVVVEVDISPAALPKTLLVGLPEAAVRESLHRVERAMVNSGFVRPQSKIVINLAPAELPKQAASFDLPISLCMLACSGQFSSEVLDDYAVVGELSLEGETRPVKGALSMAIAAAKREGLKGILVPTQNAPEAAIVEDIEVIPVSSLCEAVGFFSGQLSIDAFPSRLDQLFSTYSQYDVDYADVRGQDMVKRALCLAAAGGHNLLMLGPPGSGEIEYMTRNRSNDSVETASPRIEGLLGRFELLNHEPFGKFPRLSLISRFTRLVALQKSLVGPTYRVPVVLSVEFGAM